ncbi:metal-dependent hydrolase, partial [Pseudomonas aeruginosa]
RWLWGKAGVFRSLVGVYLGFYKKHFHPWQHNLRHLIEQ